MTSKNDTKPNPVVGMIRVILNEILERLRRGELDARRDLKTLLRHLEMAKELNNKILVGELEQMIGLIYNETGNFEEAGKHWVIAYRIFDGLGDKDWLAKIQNNLGELYYRLGKVDAAKEAYDEARQLAEEIGDNEIIMIIEGNLGLLWLLQGDYDKARICFSLVIALTEDKTWQHIYSLVNARRGLAEVHLADGDFVNAWQEANEAEALAEGRKLKLSIGLTYLTKAHIARLDPSTPGAAGYYYETGVRILREYGNPIILARTLLEEAFYQKSKNNLKEAATSAKEARQIYEEVSLPFEVELVDGFLAGLTADTD